MRLWIQDIRHSSEETPRIIPSMFRDAGAKIVKYQHMADYGIIGYTFEGVFTAENPQLLGFAPFPIPKSRVISCYEEPPFHYHMEYYESHAEYLAWFSLPEIEGCKPLTLDPSVFPYPPFTKWDRIRVDTRMRHRTVFYRGNKRRELLGGDKYGRIDLNPARLYLIQGLLDAQIPMDLMGPGWTPTNTYNLGADPQGCSTGGTWQASKRREWGASIADFHLCCENSHMSNYVTEKIHHGFQSDLVVLYLGNWRIEEYIPKEAFINLNHYYDKTTGLVDVEAVVERIRTITQEEYDSILHAARAWRKSGLEERHEAGRLRLTNLILDRFREIGAL